MAVHMPEARTSMPHLVGYRRRAIPPCGNAIAPLAETSGVVAGATVARGRYVTRTVLRSGDIRNRSSYCATPRVERRHGASISWDAAVTSAAGLLL